MKNVILKIKYKNLNIYFKFNICFKLNIYIFIFHYQKNAYNFNSFITSLFNSLYYFKIFSFINLYLTIISKIFKTKSINVIIISRILIKIVFRKLNISIKLYFFFEKRIMITKANEINSRILTHLIFSLFIQ